MGLKEQQAPATRPSSYSQTVLGERESTNSKEGRGKRGGEGRVK